MVKLAHNTHGITHETHVDLDTAQDGTAPPFQPWEHDHTALVHVLWSAKHDALIAPRPADDLPLRRALFDRLFGDHKHPFADGLIDDLRSILDAHDPNITPGAPGATRLDPATALAAREARGEQYDTCATDTVATMISGSRWHAADTAAAIARALREAADEETTVQGGPTATTERLLRRAHDHDGRG